MQRHEMFNISAQALARVLEEDGGGEGDRPAATHASAVRIVII